MEWNDELNDFLKKCVDEYGSDWSGISGEFSALAEDLDVPALRELALKQFSPEELQRHYVEIQSGSASEGEIYASGSETTAADLNSDNPSVRDAQPVINAVNSTSVVSSGTESGTNVGNVPANNVSDALADETFRHFGTTDLSEIFKRDTTIQTNPHFPSFAATLMAYGVNPNDISGPNVEYTHGMERVFDQVRQGLEGGKDYSQPVRLHEDTTNGGANTISGTYSGIRERLEDESNAPVPVTRVKRSSQGRMMIDEDSSDDDMEKMRAMRNKMKDDSKNLVSSNKENVCQNTLEGQVNQKFRPDPRITEKKTPANSASTAAAQKGNQALIRSNKQALQAHDEIEESHDHYADLSDKWKQNVDEMEDFLRNPNRKPVPTSPIRSSKPLPSVKEVQKFMEKEERTDTLTACVEERELAEELKTVYDKTVVVSKEEQERQEKEERKRFVEECERRRVIMQDKMQDFAKFMQPSEALLAKYQEVMNAQSDVLINPKARRKRGEDNSTEENSQEEAKIVEVTGDQEGPSGEKILGQGHATTAAAAGFNVVEDKSQSQSKEEALPDSPEKPVVDLRGEMTDIKELMPLVEERYQFPLLHHAASTAPRPECVPRNWMDNRDMFLLPWYSEDSPLASEDKIQLLNTVSKADVAIMVDGSDLDPQRSGVFMMIAPGDRKGLAEPFIKVSQVDSQAILSKGLAFGTHVVGNTNNTDENYTDIEDKEAVKTYYSNTCVIVVKKEPHLETLVKAASDKGIYVSGLRTLYPTSVEIDRCQSILKQHLAKFAKNILVAFRGPGCCDILRDIVGPSPEIARQTDPQSLNARFGGLDGIAVCSPPGRTIMDLAWVFGGRLEDMAPLGASRNQKFSTEELHSAARDAIRNRTIHGLHVFREVVYSGGITMDLNPGAFKDKLTRYLVHGGRILSVNPQKHKAGGKTTTFVFTGAREAGSSLLSTLNLFDLTFEKPPMDKNGIMVKNLEMHHSYAGSVEKSSTSEVCVTMLALRPGDDLSQVFRATNCGEEEYSAGLDIINCRLLDMSKVTLQPATDFFLRSPILSETARQSTVLFVVFRGENCFKKIEDYVLRRCKANFAGAQGRWKFTKTMEESYHYYTVFFDLRSFAGKSSIKSTYDIFDVRSLERYTMTLAQRAAALGVAYEDGPPSNHSGSLSTGTSTSSTVEVGLRDLFCDGTENDEIENLMGHDGMIQSNLGSSILGMSLTYCVVVKSMLPRTVSVLSQHGFSIGRVYSFEKDLPTPVKDILFKQDVYDEFLDVGKDHSAFYSNYGDGETRIFVLELQRASDACLTLQRLCGHGDPKVNASVNYVSLRKGKSAVHCGVRCTSSAESCRQLFKVLINKESMVLDLCSSQGFLLSKQGCSFRSYWKVKNADLLSHFLGLVTSEEVEYSFRQSDGLVILVWSFDNVTLQNAITKAKGKEFKLLSLMGNLRPMEKHECDVLFFHD